MDLQQAIESAKLAEDIRAVLTQSDDAPKFPLEMIERVDAIVRNVPANTPSGDWELMAAGLRVFANLEACRDIALSGQGNLLEERARGEILLGEFRRKLSPDKCSLPNHLEPIRQKLLAGIDDPEDIRGLLASIPLPTLYWSDARSRSSAPEFRSEPSSDQAPMVRMIAFLDQEPVASPQLLNQGTLYGLSFRLRGLGWPDDAIRLRLDLNTTCPPDVYALSDFVLDRPQNIVNDEYDGRLSGQMVFKAKQSDMQDSLVFAVHAAFETEDGLFTEIPVIGHNVLRVRVIEPPAWLPSRQNGPLDQRIASLIDELIKECPTVGEELDELYPLLDALGRVCATYAQEAAYKGRNDVSEEEFQKAVLHDLRIRLGASDVQEHPKQAGGIPDIRYRGVIVELKVEDEDGNRDRLAKKYTGQATQYAGVEGRQVSVLLVLDLTEKTNPPGDIRNDIILTDVATHGAEETPAFPSKAFIFVVNGNTKNPSSYSR